MKWRPGATAREVVFSDNVAVLEFHASSDISANGHPELVVVSRDPSIVEIRDSRNGALVNRFPLHPAFDPVASALFESVSGQPSIAVLSKHKTKKAVRVREYDLTTGAVLSTVYFNSSFTPMDLVAIPATGNEPQRFGVLAAKDDPNRPSKLEVRDRAGRVSNFFLGKQLTPTHAVLLPGAGYEANVAVVAQDSQMSETMVFYIDINATWATTSFGVNPNFQPKLLFATDATNSYGSAKVSILSRNLKEGKDKIETRDAKSQALFHNYWVWSTYVADGAAAVGIVPHFGEDSASAYVVLERQRATDNRRLAVIDSVTGDRLLNIALDD